MVGKTFSSVPWSNMEGLCIITRRLQKFKGPYRRALLFLPRSYSLSLLRCSRTPFPTLNVLSIMCWSCRALYLSRDFFNVSCTCKWIYLILSMNLSSFNASPMVSLLKLGKNREKSDILFFIFYLFSKTNVDHHIKTMI